MWGPKWRYNFLGECKGSLRLFERIFAVVVRMIGSFKIGTFDQKLKINKDKCRKKVIK